MSRIRIILLTTVVLVLGAGVVIGRVSAQLKSTPAVAVPGKGPNWLADQLSLNGAQRQQMDAVWAETRAKMDESFEHRRAVEHDRDDAIVKLLSPDQRIAYDKIQADFRSQHDEMNKDREKLIRSANERSRALLTVEQQQRWDQLQKTMRPWHGPNRGSEGRGSRPHTMPAGAGGPWDHP